MTNENTTIKSAKIRLAESSLNITGEWLTLDGIDHVLNEVAMERVLAGESEMTYSKVFFTIVTENGYKYEGRVDVRNHGTEQEIGKNELSIREHILQHLDYVREVDDRDEYVDFWEAVIAQSCTREQLLSL